MASKGEQKRTERPSQMTTGESQHLVDLLEGDQSTYCLSTRSQVDGNES